MNSVCLSLSGTMFLFVDLVTCDIETQVTVSFGGRYPELVEIPLLNGGTHHPTYGQKSLPFSPSSIFSVNYLILLTHRIYGTGIFTNTNG